jgi:N-acetylglucosamine-6-phosphate deacetylase
MKTKIVNGRILTPYREMTDWELGLEDDKIVRLAPRDPADDQEWTRLDAQDAYVAPGFIDLHTHGGGGHDFMDATEAAFIGAARTHAAHGTTTLLPTSLTATDEEMDALFAVYRRVKEMGTGGANLAGLHLEGPYFSASQKGAQDERYLRCPEPCHYLPILEKAGDIIARWSCAPELPGALAFGRVLRERGILASMGHSEATDEDVLAAMENGFTHITHLYSGMSSITRRRGYRYPGLLESAFLFPELTVEVIADGCHIPPSLLRLVYTTLGSTQIALVTDSMRAAGLGEGESLLGSLKNGQRCIVEQGVAKMPDHTSFAGSVATADRLLSTMVHKAGATLLDAVKMLTLTPARIASLAHKGALSVGYDADVVLFDQNFAIKKTIVLGKCVYDGEGCHV